MLANVSNLNAGQMDLDFFNCRAFRNLAAYGLCIRSINQSIQAPSQHNENWNEKSSAGSSFQCQLLDLSNQPTMHEVVGGRLTAVLQ